MWAFCFLGIIRCVLSAVDPLRSTAEGLGFAEASTLGAGDHHQCQVHCTCYRVGAKGAGRAPVSICFWPAGFRLSGPPPLSAVA